MVSSIVLIFFLLTAIGLPIAIASGVSAAIPMLLFSEIPDPLMTFIQRIQYGVDNYTLLAIPLFILCGSLMNSAGITDRIFNLAQKLVGPIPGGLAHANVVASIIFAGMSGAMLGDAGGLGKVEIKAMRERGYDPEFACAVTAASSTIGPVIPPSVVMILYGAVAEQSVGKLFLGGIIPGFLMGLSLMVLIFVMSIKRNYSRSAVPGLKEVAVAIKQAFLPSMTPVIIVGGLVTGVFVVTEAAAIACFYAFILGVFVYRQIKMKDIPGILLDSLKTTSCIMFIVGTIACVSWVLIRIQFTDMMGEFVFSVTREPWKILLMINILVLLLGALIEGAALMVLVVPIFLPLVQSVGVDPIHFGIILTINILIAGISPPIGMALFVISGVANVEVEKLFRAIIPFLIPLIIILLLITYISPLSMAIPNWLMPDM